MGSLVEHALINKLDNDLNNAIKFVGGDTSNVTHISQYPDVIKGQLSSTGNIIDLDNDGLNEEEIYEFFEKNI
jgi:hypothetical protein